MVIEYYYGGSWVDITNYVTGADAVPYEAKNRDFSIKLDTWQIQVAQSLNTISPFNSGWTGFTFDERIRILDDTSSLFSGFIKSSSLGYSSLEFDVEILPDLARLQDYLVDYPTLHNAIVAGSPTSTQYRSQSYFLMPTVYFMYLFQKMFTIAGMTLDTSDIDDEVAFNFVHDLENPPGNKDITYKELFTGEWMLYCVGLSVMTYYTVIESDKNYKSKKATFFTLLDSVLQALNITIDLVSTDNYKLSLRASSSISIADDDKYEYSKETFRGEETITQLAYVNLDNLIIYSRYYLSGVANSNPGGDSWFDKTFGINQGTTKLSWLDNLSIWYEHEVTPFDPAKTLPILFAEQRGNRIRLTLGPSHGFSVGDKFLIRGVAGMDDINNYINPTAGDEKTVVDRVYIGYDWIEYYAEVGTAYIAGGWVYKGTGAEYDACSVFHCLNAKEITNGLYLSTGEINQYYNQIIQKSSDNIREEITTEKQTTLASVLENNIDPEWETSEIIQETY